MGTELIVAGIGLAISAVGTGYSIYASEKAADEAEEMAERNADREAKEAEEIAQRAEKDAAREESLARAKAFASGAGGESTDLYLKDLTATNKREIDWIRSSGASRAGITRDTGKNAASAYRREGVAAGISGAGQVAAGAMDWYSSYANKPKTPSYDASYEHKQW